MPICDDELAYVCEECYQVIYDDCISIIIDLGLNGNTTYCIKLYDKFGNTYNQEITTEADGSFTIDESVLPDNFFNLYSGKIELQIFNSCDSDTRISFTQAYLSYNCLLLINSESEEADEDTTPTPIDTDNSVSILNAETDELIASVPCGGEYGVLVFSGIDEGNSTTTYSNSIVDS